MSKLRQFIDKQVEIEITGKNTCSGKVIDTGLDLIVLYSNQQYYYIPLVHIQRMVECEVMGEGDEEGSNLNEDPLHQYEDGGLSFRKVLHHVKGQFVEIYVTGNKSIHGYLTSVMNDYFVFYSPVYKAMFISMNHLKWLIPYRPDHTPYTLNHQLMPLQPISISLTRSFEDLCKRLEGNLVVFDFGDNPDKIGLLSKIDNQMIELINANGVKVYWNLQHLKVVNVP